MGNNCCKERISRANDSKNPVDRLIGRCAQICPNMLPQDNKNWGKHVLETRPPQQTQPQKSATLDGWRTATLSVPDNTTSTKPQIVVKEVLPVAPPRKKRRAASFAALPTKSQLTDRKSSMVPNGFRDVFGREERRYSTESALNDRASKSKSLDSRLASIDNTTKLRRHSSYSSSLDEFADFSKESSTNQNDTLTRVVPRIGNKKTDQFFGESLAAGLTAEERRKSSIAETDFFHLQKRKQKEAVLKENVILNTSPVRPPPPNPPKRRNSSLKDGELAVKIEKSTVSETAPADLKPEEKSSSLDRKAKFLMDMLEPSSPLEEHYKGRTPVEEPLLVAKKNKIKCVCCDDDDQLKHYLHLHEKKAGEIDLSNPPRKPSRDFTKIQTKNVESENKMPEVSISDLPPQRTNRVKRSVTHSDTDDNLKKISEQSVKIHRNISMPTVESLLQSEEELESLMQRCLSSNSFEAHDIIDELIQKAYPGFDGISSILHDQQHDSYDDGSHLVSPSSKLDSKKNSFVRLNSMSSVTSSGVSNPIETDQEIADKKTTFSIGRKEIALSDFNKNGDGLIDIDTKSAVIAKPNIKVQSSEVIEKPEIKETKEIVTESERPKVNKDEILCDENPQQTNLDDSAINDLIESSDLTVNNLTSVLDDIYANNKTIVDDFHNYLEVEANKKFVTVHKIPSKAKLSESESEKPGDSIKSDPKSDYESDEEDIEDDDLPHNKPIQVLKYNRPRRDSIDDVDIWFSRHSAAPINKTLDGIVHGMNLGRRSSEGNYDTSKIYPFGRMSRERTTSESSSDFFENRHRSISQLNLEGMDDEPAIQMDKEKASLKNTTDTKNDHSTLLAILKKESPKKDEK